MSVEVRETNEELLDTEEDKTAQPDELLDVCSDMTPDKSGKAKVLIVDKYSDPYLSFLFSLNMMVCCSNRFGLTNPRQNKSYLLTQSLTY